MQRRNLVVKAVTAPVETTRVQRERIFAEGCIDMTDAICAGGGSRLFQQAQTASGVSVSVADQGIDSRIVKCQPLERGLGCRLKKLAQLVVAKRLQHVHLSTREQGRVDLERWVFGRGADKGHQP